MLNKKKTITLLFLLITTLNCAPKKRKRFKNKLPKMLKLDSIYLTQVPNNQMDAHLSQFSIDQLSNPAINPRDQVEFDFDFDIAKNEENAVVWVSYLTRKNAEVQFEIMDRADNSVIYSHKKRKEFLGKISFKKSESVKFIIRNIVYNTYANVLVGFTCQNCFKKDQLANSKDIERTKKKIKDINMIRSQIYFMSELLKENKVLYLENLKKSHSKLYVFGVLEIFVVFLVNLFQLFTIKNLIVKKKLF